MVRQLDVLELARMLAADQRFELIDVRTDEERAVASLAAARPYDLETDRAIAGMQHDTPLVFLCHHGFRSQHAALHFANEGFTDVANVQGGIDAWSRLVDPGVARY